MTATPEHAVLSEVRAVVSAAAEEDLVRLFRELLEQPLPDGLLRTELLRDGDGTWRLQSLWRDRSALEAVRTGPEPPAAPTLFRSVGAEPTLVVLEVVVSHPDPR